MVRKLLLVLVVLVLGAGCKDTGGGGKTPECEKARDQYLANYQERMTALLAEDTDKQRVNDQRDFDVEVTNIKAKFVDACNGKPAFKFDCFASVAKEDSAECKPFVKELSHQVAR